MTIAMLPPDDPGFKAEYHEQGIHKGIWYSRAAAYHGFSRSGMNFVIDLSGTTVFTRENPDIPIGARVRFEVVSDPVTCEQVAVNVTPIEPVATVTAPKVVPRSKK